MKTKQPVKTKSKCKRQYHKKTSNTSYPLYIFIMQLCILCTLFTFNDRMNDVIDSKSKSTISTTHRKRDNIFVYRRQHKGCCSCTDDAADLLDKGFTASWPPIVPDTSTNTTAVENPFDNALPLLYVSTQPLLINIGSLLLG